MNFLDESIRMQNPKPLDSNLKATSPIVEVEGAVTNSSSSLEESKYL
jgi:hypothetical protein